MIATFLIYVVEKGHQYTKLNIKCQENSFFIKYIATNIFYVSI